MGVNLATTGGDNLSEQILGSSSFNELLQGKTNTVINAVKGSYKLYEQTG